MHWAVPTLFLFFFDKNQFVMWYCPFTCGWSSSHVCTEERLPRKKAQVVSPSYAQWTILREFPDYWWLFPMQKVPRYGTRLSEERRKKAWKKMNNYSDFRLFQVCRLVTTNTWLLHVLLLKTALDCAKLYRLLYVFLDVSICSLAIILPCKC